MVFISEGLSGCISPPDQYYACCPSGLLTEPEVGEIIIDFPEYIKKQQDIKNKGKQPDHHQVEPLCIVKLVIEFFKRCIKMGTPHIRFRDQVDRILFLDKVVAYQKNFIDLRTVCQDVR